MSSSPGRCVDPPCRHCGARGSYTARTVGFLAGMQYAAYLTYLPNIDAALVAKETPCVPGFNDAPDTAASD